ncbi:hypothetical protein O1M54_17345 [Streptomyces diastatochromogenes]|nr:hypothetical protein [Streptomyces diastatochromogenes]
MVPLVEQALGLGQRVGRDQVRQVEAQDPGRDTGEQLGLDAAAALRRAALLGQGRGSAGRAVVGETGRGEGGEVAGASAEVPFHISRAVLEHEAGRVLVEGGQEQVLHPARVGEAGLGLGAGELPEQPAEQHLGQFHGAGVGQHRPLDQLHHGEREGAAAR